MFLLVGWCGRSQSAAHAWDTHIAAPRDKNKNQKNSLAHQVKSLRNSHFALQPDIPGWPQPAGRLTESTHPAAAGKPACDAALSQGAPSTRREWKRDGFPFPQILRPRGTGVTGIAEEGERVPIRVTMAAKGP